MSSRESHLEQIGREEGSATALSVYLLGGFRVFRGRRPVPDGAWRLRKAQVLVQVLALAPQNALHREQLMELLWPQRAPEVAARNLHQVLHAARKALSLPAAPQHSKAGQVLQVRQQVVRLQPQGPLWVDAAAFEEAAARARQAGQLEEYARALAFYSGHLLPESPYDEVFVQPRRRLAELRQRLLLEMAALYEAQSAWTEALANYDRVLAEDATVEAAVAGALRVCRSLADRHEAARYFNGYVRQIRDELGLEPDPEIVRLYQGCVELRPRPVPARQPTAPDAAGVPAGGSAPGHGPGLVPSTAALPLVGREPELKAMASGLADRSRGHIFFITGEAGIGKSRLVREACRQDGAAHVPSAFGYGVGWGETPPFGPWRQLLHEYEARTGRRRAGLPAPFGNGAPAPSVMELALDVAEFLAAGPPAVIVLEDLHWFDPGSLQLLRHALPRLRRSTVHLMVTCRDEEISAAAQLEQTVQALMRFEAQVLNLRRLGRAEVQALAASVGRPQRAQLVYERSGGHPFFAYHLLLAHGTELPWTIKQALAQQLGALQPASTTILQIAAVFGATFSAETVQEAARVSSEQMSATLKEGLQHGILRRQGLGYVFSHELFRQALTENLSAGQRASLHRRAAAASENPDEKAYHLGAAGDRAAVPLLHAAGRRAMLWGALEQAHRHFQRALQLAPENDPLRGELLLLLAVRIDIDPSPLQRAQQKELLEQAITAAAKAQDKLVQGLAQHYLAEILFMQEDERSLDMLEQALQLLAQVEDDQRAADLKALLDRRLLLNPGLLNLMYALRKYGPAGDPVAASRAAVADRAPWLGGYEDRIAAGFAHIIKGNVVLAVEELLAAGERAMVTRSYSAAAAAFTVACNLYLWHLGTDRAGIESIVERVGEAMERARQRTGSDPFPDDNLLLPYWFWYGHWDRVRQAYENFVAAGGVFNDSMALLGYVYGVVVLGEQGNSQAALEGSKILLPPGGPGRPPELKESAPQMAYIVVAIGMLLTAGEYTLARAWLKTLDAWHGGPRPNRITESWTLIQWAEWHRAQGDAGSVVRKAQEALALTKDMPSTWVDFNAWRLLGAVGGAKATDYLDRAIDLAQRCGYPFDLARGLLERGRSQDLVQAKEIFTQLGAEPYLQKIRRMAGN